MTDTPTTAPEPRSRPLSIPDGDALADLLSDEPLVLLELRTSGCGICASMEPVLGLVAKATPATVATLNAGDALDVADEYAIHRVPTLLLFRDGEVVGRRDDGFVAAAELVEWVAEFTD